MKGDSLLGACYVDLARSTCSYVVESRSSTCKSAKRASVESDAMCKESKMPDI